MFRRLREVGPAFLVPAAWSVVIAQSLGAVTPHPVFVMHVVMSVLLVAFAGLSWSEMETGVLGTWRRVIVVGTPFALAGLAGFLVPSGSTPLFAAALVGWMLLPAAGFLDTARQVSNGVRIYQMGAALCVVAVALYALGPLLDSELLSVLGLVAVAVGQTAGILDAVLRY